MVSSTNQIFYIFISRNGTWNDVSGGSQHDLNNTGPWGDDKMGLSGNTGGPWPNSEWGPGPKSKNSWGDCSNNDMDPSSWGGPKNIVSDLNPELFKNKSIYTNIKIFIFLLFRDKKIKIRIIYGKVKHIEFLLKWELRFAIFFTI